LFPEVFITSDLLAEGIYLHRYCRVVINHDLDWNLSVIEQHTGRMDRISTKMELVSGGNPIRVYVPYLSETQDEKRYRVPLPEAVVKELAFHLEIVNQNGSKASKA